MMDLKEKKEPEQGGTHLEKCCHHLGGRYQGLEVILENKRLIWKIFKKHNWLKSKDPLSVSTEV